MGVLEFLVPFYQINTARVVFSSDLKMDPLNLYPIYMDVVLPNVIIIDVNIPPLTSPKI